MIGKAIFLFILFVVLMTEWSQAGLPPTTLKGQQDTSKTTTFNFEVPNSLATKTSTGTLIENGNKNILTNPSFEHSTAITGWTSTTVTPSASTSTIIDGKQSLCFSASSQAFTLYQDSTLYASAFSDGVQGLAMARIQTNHSGAMTVCSKQAGTASTTNCVTVNANGKWGQYKIPFILGGTSNGIIISAASGSGTTCVDDAFVGAVNLKQDINVVGPWQSYTPTLTGFGTASSVSFKWRQVGDEVEIRGHFVAGTPTPVTSQIGLPNNYTIDSNKVIGSQNDYLGIIQRSQNATVSFPSTTLGPFVLTYTSSVSSSSLIPSVQSANGSTYASVTGSGLVSAAGEHFTISAKVPVTQLSGASSVYTAQNADTDWQACNFSTLAWTGLGTVTQNLICKRQGSDLLMKGYFTTGTVAATTAQIPLPLWSGAQLTSKSGTTNTVAGRIVSNASGANRTKDNIAFYTGGNTYLWGSYPEYAVAASPLSAQTGSALFGSSEIQSVDLRIPIDGWTNSNVIIGTFNEVMTAPGVTKPKTCYYGFGGASATLAAPTECTTGTCVEVYDSCGTGTPPTWATTSLYNNFTFANGTFAPNTYLDCQCRAWDVTSLQERKCDPYFETGDNTWSTNSNGGYVVNLYTTNTVGTGGTAYVQVKCEGQAP